MALVYKWFGNRKNSPSEPSQDVSGGSFNPWRGVCVPVESISVLVYRECDRRGLRLLFDSSSVVQLTARAGSKSSDPPQYRYQRRRANARLLGEMAFGSAPINFCGATCKLHVLEDSRDMAGDAGSACRGVVVMLSRVFPACSSTLPASSALSRPATPCASSYASTPPRIATGSSSGLSEVCLMRSVAVLSPAHSPSLLMGEASLCVTDDSGVSSGDSFHAPPSCVTTPYGTPALNHGWCVGEQWRHHDETQWRTVPQFGHTPVLSQFGSLQRRARTATTPVKTPVPRRANSASAGLLSDGGRGGVSRAARAVRHSQTRLAVTVLISSSSSDQQCSNERFQHVVTQLTAQLGRVMVRLQQAVGVAYTDKSRFVHLVFEAATGAKQDITLLLGSDRMARPVWLGMTSSLVSTNQRLALARQFASQLADLADLMDTKEMNCFVTSLLTAVLTHHVGWVKTTVATPGGGCHNYSNSEHSTGGADDRVTRAPFSRTMVLGGSWELVDRVLCVLSYFIRPHNVQMQPTICSSQCADSGRHDVRHFARVVGDGDVDDRCSQTRATSSRVDQLTVNPVRTRHRTTDSGSTVRHLAAMSDVTRRRHHTVTSLSARRLELRHGRLPNAAELEGQVGDEAAGVDITTSLSQRSPHMTHSDSLRNSMHYLRGYRSFRFSQGCVGAAAARGVLSSQSRRDLTADSSSSHPSSVSDHTPLPQPSEVGEDLSAWCDLAAVCDHYMPDLVLTGCLHDQHFAARLAGDLRSCHLSGERCVCVLADLDTRSVSVVCSERVHAGSAEDGLCELNPVSVVLSPLVSTLLESTCQLHGRGVPALLLLRHVENQLAVLTSRAAELAQYLYSSTATVTPPLHHQAEHALQTCDMQSVCQCVGVESTDVPVLLAICSVMYPRLTTMFSVVVH